jgi:HEAT repeat protein
MNRSTVAGFALAVLTMAGSASAQPGAADSRVADLKNPSTRTRIDALRQLGDQARVDAAVPMAVLLLDGNDDVQFAAVESLLKLYTVRTDLGKRPWGVPAVGRLSTLPEAAFEAGPLATIPAAVPAEVLINLSSVMRHDETGRVRLAAAYALGVLAAPAMGPMSPAAVDTVTADLTATLSHTDSATRQLAARIAGRIYAPDPGKNASAAVGDALVTTMNDTDPLVRRWAMDSLGWLHYDRALQALTDRASYYGKSEEGAAGLHALARIANPGSAVVLRALLASPHAPFRLLAIEGLGRIGDRAALPQITESASTINDAGVELAAAYARFLFGLNDVVPIADTLEKNDTALQAKVYLAEIAMTRPSAIHPLLMTPNPSSRMIAVEVLGASRQPAEVAVLQPLMKDASPDVVDAAGEAIRRLQAYAAVGPKP